jgi:peptide/nickel transport system ATP-binding protein
MTALLEVRHLAIGFARYTGSTGRERLDALHDISLDVPTGRLTGIIGASGSGKSLLALAIFGVLPANAVMSGTVRIEGRLIGTDGLSALRGRFMALVPQTLAALDPLVRVGVQVQRAARLAGLSALDAVAARRSVFARYGLAEDVADLMPFQLSGGMARRVLIAFATVGGARLIVADEPTVGLDPVALGAMLADLRSLADEGRAVAVISHDLAALATVADEIVVIRDGRSLGVEPARAFTGDGEHLMLPYARDLWRALPINGMWRPAHA